MGVTPNVRAAARDGTARLHAALSAAVGTDQWTLVDWHGTAVSGLDEPRCLVDVPAPTCGYKARTGRALGR